jgi:hypothetical protein
LGGKGELVDLRDSGSDGHKAAIHGGRDHMRPQGKITKDPIAIAFASLLARRIDPEFRGAWPVARRWPIERGGRVGFLGAIATLLVASLWSSPADASFHLMQIRQVMGGVCGGDRGQQAILLRMRADGQNEIAGTSLVVYDGTGTNPITLITFPSNVANGAAGRFILVVSEKWAQRQGLAPDFILTNLIPTSYLSAGRLTFRQGSTVYWSVAWGGYTGSNAGTTDNDADGNFGPPFAQALPGSGMTALTLLQAPHLLHVSNATNYSIPAVASLFTNNAGNTGAPIQCDIFEDDFESADLNLWSAATGQPP